MVFHIADVPTRAAVSTAEDHVTEVHMTEDNKQRFTRHGDSSPIGHC